MTLLNSQDWTYLFLILVLGLTVAQLVVIFALSAYGNPPAGLGFYTVYFLAALLVWVAYSLQQLYSDAVSFDVPGVAAMINSFILFLAVSQRAAFYRGRLLLGAIATAGMLGVFLLPPAQTLLVQHGIILCLSLITAAVAGWRSLQTRNVGESITVAGLLIISGGIIWSHASMGAEQPATALAAWVFGLQGVAYVLIAAGFLASVMLEYQGQLLRLSVEDPLTGLPNERGLREALRITLASAVREARSVTAVVVDIDQMRTINDSFGHDIGDHVVLAVADRLRVLARASDIVARTDGDAFTFILPGQNMENARPLADRIRESVSETVLQVDQYEIPVTVSVGMAEASGEISLDTLCEDAERAVTLAKRGGRNRVASLGAPPVRVTANSGAA